MLIRHADSLSELALPDRVGAGSTGKPAEIESEVIHMFEQLRNPLLRYVISLGLSLHDGEEVIQEVFLALFRHLQLGKSKRNLRGWVFRVAHNLALRQHLVNRRAQAKLNSDQTVAHRQPDGAPNPEEQVASSQQLERMQSVLRALPEQDRCCLTLRAEGLRYREIATALGMSLGSVSIALTRSLARLECANRG